MPQNMKSSDRFRTVFDSSVLSFFNKSIRIQNLQMLNANINCSSKNNILKKVIFDYCIHPSLLVHWRKWLFPSISYITCYAAQIRKRLLNYWIKKKKMKVNESVLNEQTFWNTKSQHDKDVLRVDLEWKVVRSVNSWATNVC